MKQHEIDPKIKPDQRGYYHCTVCHETVSYIKRFNNEKLIYIIACSICRSQHCNQHNLISGVYLCPLTPLGPFKALVKWLTIRFQRWRRSTRMDAGEFTSKGKGE